MQSSSLQKKSKVVCALFPLETSHAVAVISVPPKYMLTSISRSLPFEVSGVNYNASNLISARISGVLGIWIGRYVEGD